MRIPSEAELIEMESRLDSLRIAANDLNINANLQGDVTGYRHALACDSAIDDFRRLLALVRELAAVSR